MPAEADSLDDTGIRFCADELLPFLSLKYTASRGARPLLPHVRAPDHAYCACAAQSVFAIEIVVTSPDTGWPIQYASLLFSELETACTS